MNTNLILLVVVLVQLACCHAFVSTKMVSNGIKYSKRNALLNMSFDTKVFKKEAVDMAGTTEFVVKGSTSVS